MDEDDARLSREITEALNSSMPDVVQAAGRGRTASTMLTGGAVVAAAVGIGAAIFGSALATTPALFAVILVVFAVIIVVEIVAFVVGLRAKRAFTRIAETVASRHRATLVRVVGREVHVRS
jgi:CBS domain containing-hemolysin-like protein